MQISQLIEQLQALQAEHGDVLVFLPGAGSDEQEVVRLRSLLPVVAVGMDLGNGVAAYTLDDTKAGSQVPGLLLD